MTAGLVAQGIGSLAKSAFGAYQARQGKKELERLAGQRPAMYVPSAIRTRAAEPIAEEYMQASEDAASRRLAGGIGALQTGGSRALLGGLPSLVESDRIGSRERTAAYEQERQRALGELGAAEERLQGREMENYLRQVQGASGQMGAGTQNIFTGLGEIGSGVLTADILGAFGDKQQGSGSQPSMSQSPSMNLSGAMEAIPGQEQEEGEYLFTPQDVSMISRYMRKLKTGGKLPGKFSHSENPMHIIDDNGKKVAEATGNETVFNPSQMKKILKESPSARKYSRMFAKRNSK